MPQVVQRVPIEPAALRTCHHVKDTRRPVGPRAAAHPGCTRSGAPRRETGPADAVARAAAAEDATISSVTYAQVLHKTARLGVTAEDVDAELGALIVSVSHFGRLDARSAASFPRDRSGLGLADPLCPALARSSSSLAYAADRVRQNWVDDLGVDARVTR